MREIKFCKQCLKELPISKPSKPYVYCNKECYFKWRKENLVGVNHQCFKTGESRTRIYTIWLGIKRRCFNTKCVDYKNYGGRGIDMDFSWQQDFLCFKEWALNNRYADNLTIERIDVNGNYEPSNCTWIPNCEQYKNTRNAKKNYVQRSKSR